MEQPASNNAEAATKSDVRHLAEHTDARFSTLGVRQNELREDIRDVAARSEKRDSELQSDIRGLTYVVIGLFGGLCTTLAGVVAASVLG